MTEHEGAKPEVTDDAPAVPPHDIRLSVAERDALHDVISEIFADEPAIFRLLRRIGYPLPMVPSMTGRASDEIWADIFHDLDNGIIADPYKQLVGAAIRVYAANETLRSIAQRYGLSEVEPSATQAPAPAEQTSTDTYHVIVRADGEDDRRRVQEVLERLGLEPREVWSTAHAVSYRLASADASGIRRRLESERTNLGWTLVAPGEPDYLISSLFVRGPDGRQFRIVDAPAQQTVGNVAAEVVDQYPTGFADTSRPAVVDRVDPSGQSQRLSPEETLHDAGVKDGDQLRVSSLAYAGVGSASVKENRPSVDEFEFTLHELMVEQQRIRLEREQVKLERERLRLRQEDLKLKQEELILQEVSGRVSKSTRIPNSSDTGMTFAEDIPPADLMQLAIYADVEEDTKEWRRLSSAGEAVAKALGYVSESQLPTEYGSVFHRGFWKRIVTSEEARQYEAMLQQALGLKVAMLNQAEVDSKQAAAAAGLIAALAAVPTACVKVGSLLLIKYAVAPHDDPVILVRSLSSREVQAIDRYPAILKNPHTALDALTMAITAAEPSETTANEPGPE